MYVHHHRSSKRTDARTLFEPLLIFMNKKHCKNAFLSSYWPSHALFPLSPIPMLLLSQFCPLRTYQNVKVRNQQVWIRTISHLVLPYPLKDRGHSLASSLGVYLNRVASSLDKHSTFFSCVYFLSRPGPETDCPIDTKAENHNTTPSMCYKSSLFQLYPLYFFFLAFGSPSLPCLSPRLSISSSRLIHKILSRPTSRPFLFCKLI